MKVTVHDILVNCPKHGKVPYTASSDLGGEVVTMYCPRCEEEARQQHLHPASPYPIQGTSPSVIEHVQSRRLRIADTDSLSIVAQTFQFVHSCRDR